MKVLIVDDFEMIRVVLNKTLCNLGVEKVHQAANGELALRSIEQAAEAQEPFDLVFVDWNMPGMSGLELLRLCKKDGRIKDVPIIMVTSESDRSSVLEALMSGAIDYVIKPFSPEIIARKIEAVSEMAAKVS